MQHCSVTCGWNGPSRQNGLSSLATAVEVHVNLHQVLIRRVDVIIRTTIIIVLLASANFVSGDGSRTYYIYRRRQAMKIRDSKQYEITRCCGCKLGKAKNICMWRISVCECGPDVIRSDWNQPCLGIMNFSVLFRARRNCFNVVNPPSNFNG